MGFCSHCGKPISEGARFCGHCGTPVAPQGAGAGAEAGVPAPAAVSASPSIAPTAPLPVDSVGTAAPEPPTQTLPAGSTQPLPVMPGVPASPVAQPTQALPVMHMGGDAGTAGTQPTQFSTTPLPLAGYPTAQPQAQPGMGQVPAPGAQVPAPAVPTPYAMTSSPLSAPGMPDATATAPATAQPATFAMTAATVPPAPPMPPAAGAMPAPVPSAPAPIAATTTVSTPGAPGAVPNANGMPGFGTPGIPTPGEPFAPAMTAPGAMATGTAAMAAVPARPRKKRWIPALIAAIMAVVVIGGSVAWAIPNFSTVRQVLHIGPQNPFAITANAVASLRDLHSTRFELTGDSTSIGMRDSVNISGMIALGDTTDDSTMDATVKVNGNDSDSLRFAWNHGAFGAGVSSDASSHYIYADSAKLRSSLESVLRIVKDRTTAQQYTDLTFKVKDALVKNGRIDYESVRKTLDDGMASIDDDYARSYRAANTDDPEASKQLTAMMVEFTTKELEKKDVQSRVFPSVTSVKESGQTRLTYTVDLEELAHVIGNYWKANGSKYPKARDAIVQAIKNEHDGMSDADANESLDETMDNLTTYDMGDDKVDMQVNVAYALGYKLNELGVTLTQQDGGSGYGSGDGDSTAGFTLKLSDQNKLRPNSPEVARFISDAQSRNEWK